MRRRIVPATAAVTLVLAGLTGCAASAPSAEACVSPLSPGALSESVTLTGVSAGVPEATIDAGVEIVNPQRSIIEAAEERGTVAAAGTIVAANIAYFDSITGKVIESSPGFGSGTGSDLFLASDQGGPVLQGLLCSAPGDVVAIGLPAELSADAVTTPGASLVVVAEVVEVFAGVAEGTLANLPYGFPAVVTNEDGRPGVVLPPQDAPASTKSAARITGDGPTVSADNLVIGNVLTIGWDGSQLKNTWDSSPENFGTEEQIAQSGATFRSALTGYPVGSQVVVIEPGDGAPRVSVVDILAIA